MSACPHTDNADKCTCGPGCGCEGYPAEPEQPSAAILEVQQAVVAEMRRFMEHMRSTARDGLTIDKWINDGIDWYLDES